MGERFGGFTPGRIVAALFGGQRSGPPPAVMDYLRDHGSDRVIRVRVHRLEISPTLQGLAQFLTFGEWSKAQKAAHLQRIFHVVLVITIQSKSGAERSIVLEKRPVVRIRDQVKEVGGESMSVDRIPSDLSLNQLLWLPSQRWGARFWNFDPRDDNCQDFLLYILAFWRMLTPTLYRFIKQSMTVMLQPAWTHHVVNAATDLAARADILAHGGCYTFPCL